MAIHKERNPLESIKDFLAAWNEVATKGFLSQLKVEVSTPAKNHVSLVVDAVGYVPDHKKDLKDGVAVYIDPISALEKIRSQIVSGELKHLWNDCIIKTDQDWPKWDRAGENVVAILGTKHKLFFAIQTKNARRKNK